MSTNTHLKLIVNDIHLKSKRLTDELNALVKGRKVRILSGYNGQPYGRSKKKLTGEVFEVEYGHLDPYWGISLKLKGERLYIRESEIEWVEE